ncbi:MAG: efflux RND transporter permease subunit [Bacteroidia bacterium]|nr:efflux RND transporter permease subunit [Bacteroidia bacterium]
MKQFKTKFKEFFATSWAIENKTSVYVLAVFLSVIGIMSYFSIAKEQFPEIVIPQMLINTPYPGTSPIDMENLVTRPIEKQVKSLAGIKNITSNSIQDFSSILVEFQTDVDVTDAKQRVKDAVDKARTDLPNNLPRDPDVMEIDFSEIPIMYIQISGNYSMQALKKFADDTQDKIESLPEITRVDIVGALEREIQINVDIYKMQAAFVTFADIERAVSSENVTVSAGNIETYGMQRSIRVTGQFTSPDDMRKVVFKSATGAIVYLTDIAEIKDGFKEQESYSRLGDQNVITLNVIKKSGKNLIDASDKIKDLIENDLKKNIFPTDLKVTLTGDMSTFTRNTLEELNNTAIIGFLLVTIILMFFMGFNNAFFVGLSVPLSMFVVYTIMPGIGFTMNMMVMFAFIFALGIIVDDAIVVIENTHRIHRTEPDIVLAAKRAAGEVFAPILSGTLTTLAPFFPLAFWPGIVGKFMQQMPITLIMALFASLFVAYIINPVFAVSFMKHEYTRPVTKFNLKESLRRLGMLLGFGIALHLLKWHGMGNFLFFCLLAYLLFSLVIKKWIYGFQNKFWPRVMVLYESQLRFFLKGRNAYYLLFSIVALFFITIVIVSIKKPKVLFFPDNQPNNIYVMVKMPIGTHQNVTDSVTRIVANRVTGILGKENADVESMITNVAVGAGSQNSTFDRSMASNLGKVSVNFKEFKYRKGQSTTSYLDKIRQAVKGIPGAEISVEKNRMGPPTGKPINVEISSENLFDLIAVSNKYKAYLDSLQIPGIEEIKSDFQDNKPEIVIDIDRSRANMEGITTGQVGMEIRTAVFGKEISKYKEGEDEYPIQLRYSEKTRKNIDAILNLKITYRDMTNGAIRQIPLSSVAKLDYSSTYGGIKRKNLKRVITISSEVLSGFTPNEVLAKVQDATQKFTTKPGVTFSYTGENKDQQETMSFLFKALLISLGLIFFILITQFNSVSKTLIILSEVIFSIIGVLLGIVIFGMSISVIMTGLGIVALGGIVVRNGILIVEFCDVMKSRGLRTREAIIQAGKTRITPVLLTATATMLGLVPLAIGLNVNFVSLFTDLDPQIHMGGDNVMFWGPLSWTIIFGLSFATFLTLVFVPAMYYIDYNQKLRWRKRRTLKRTLKKFRENS